MRPPIHYRTFNLPSHGVLYNGMMPEGAVEIRKLTVGEEMVIQSTTPDIIGKLVDACVKMPDGVDASQLLIGDRLALFLALRVQTFGPKYSYSYECVHCGAKNKSSVDLSADVKPQYGSELLTEPFVVTLPDAECTVSLRFLRGTDEAIIAKTARATTMKSNDATDPSNLLRMALQLVAVNGEAVTQQSEREEFVKYLTLPDAKVWRDAIDAVEPGIDLTVTDTCATCAGTNKTQLPFTSEFFRPT